MSLTKYSWINFSKTVVHLSNVFSRSLKNRVKKQTEQKKCWFSLQKSGWRRFFFKKKKNTKKNETNQADRRWLRMWSNSSQIYFYQFFSLASLSRCVRYLYGRLMDVFFLNFLRPLFHFPPPPPSPPGAAPSHCRKGGGGQWCPTSIMITTTAGESLPAIGR